MILLGSIVNGAAIAVGGFAGLFVGKLLPDRMQKTLMSALALVVIGIAVPGISDSQKPLVPILSMVLGTVLGELLDLDSALIRLGDWLQRRTGGRGKFTDGFVNSTMVFAVGAMSIMGALNSGSITVEMFGGVPKSMTDILMGIIIMLITVKNFGIADKVKKVWQKVSARSHKPADDSL